MSVSPARFGSSIKELSVPASEQYDIDFSVMSYHVGHEKPDKRIFEAAEEMLMRTIESRRISEHSPNDASVGAWRKIYIGDEYAKDVVGALGAGWNAVLVDRERGGESEDVMPLDDEPVGSLYDVFEKQRAVAFRSLSRLAEWLPAKH
jgi:FMN phosphatase YigB (HAD superfamily)